jgi:8-oxo-dGTP pyrophosphatase MutT (NUDIX family)
MGARITRGKATVSDQALFHDAMQQVAALCWRPARGAPPAMPEVLLVTTLSTRRWILPKGWPVAGLSLARSAAQEALEEAGATGQVGETPLGDYFYLKEKKDGSALPCRVSVFALKVSGHHRRFPEKGARELAWLPLDEAARRVSEPGLGRILLDFGKSFGPARKRA